ncbi:nijmegen breakage syndrome 1 protein isoform X2 [Carica papaya]|nr:nijmegen breakage syndrome 1 protein isoform X2 [Carica papaya]
MTSLNPLANKSSKVSSNVRIKDESKYGTFVTSEFGTKEKVNELPNKEKVLKDGDMITFGTINANYRFCFVPFIFFICCSDQSQKNHSVQDKISSIGASVTSMLSQECTHVLVDQNMLVDMDLVNAIVAKKPLVQTSWLEFMTGQRIGTEIPSCSGYTPSVTVGGVSVKVADAKARGNCLEGYTFLLESRCTYKFGDRFRFLLEVGGGKTLSTEEFSSNSQDSEYGEMTRVVYVISKGSANKFDCVNKLSSLSRVNEMDLICAVLSGNLDPSVLISPCVFISSSCSTDETVVAESDVEGETAASVPATHVVASKDTPRSPRKAGSIDPEASRSDDKTDMIIVRENTSGMVAIRDRVDESGYAKVDDSGGMVARRDRVDESGYAKVDDSGGMVAIRAKFDESEDGNLDIIYSQDLIVRDSKLTLTVSSMANKEVVNFKRFRKMHTEPGNSFGSLIPFSKYPYKDSDYENGTMAESVKEEKKRKQMEAIAEDLFNSEKGRRRGVAGSIHGLLTRS